MDQCGSSQYISSKVLIKDEIDIDFEDCDNDCEGSYDVENDQESYHSISIPDCDNGRERSSNVIKIKRELDSLMSAADADYNRDMKEENDFVIDEHGKRCCVWVKETPTPLLLKEPNLPLLTLPEGTEIIKLKPVNHTKPINYTKPVNYTKPMRFKKNSERVKDPSNVESRVRESSKTEKKDLKDEFEAMKVLWTSKLQRLEETQRVLAEDLINQILKKGFFKDLTPNTTLTDRKYRPY